VERTQQRRIYYGWVVVGTTALALLISVGVRAAPSVLIGAIERDLGWSRTILASAAAIGLLLYGLVGPFAGTLIERIGPRRVALLGLALIGMSMIAGAGMTAAWQPPIVWGLLSGLGTGLIAPVLGAAVATRWFIARRGVALGLLGATSSAGQLLFVPVLMWLSLTVGWRIGSLLLAALALLALAPVARLLLDDPTDVGLSPYSASTLNVAMGPGDQTGASVWQAIRTPAFWLLASSFAICGATSNGLVTTHFMTHTHDHGVAPMMAASALAVMGSMNFVGTVGAGWLTDRTDPRRLLALFFAGRGVALVFLPFAGDVLSFVIFAIIFGLDYYATVPPTQVLTADLFGRRQVGQIFGWLFVAHQAGAATAAALGGLAHSALGDYSFAFFTAAGLLVLAALLALSIKPTRPPVPGPWSQQHLVVDR
jgi:MFS family permease